LAYNENTELIYEVGYSWIGAQEIYVYIMATKSNSELGKGVNQ
jgi:hypothetical protein